MTYDVNLDGHHDPGTQENVDEMNAPPDCRWLDSEREQPSILLEAEGLVNGARRAEYGPAEKGFEEYAVGWGVIIGAPVSAEQVALCMGWLKICRECQGHKRDSLVDAAGYMQLAHLCAEAAAS
jgi:hypothetical protein